MSSFYALWGEEKQTASAMKKSSTVKKLPINVKPLIQLLYEIWLWFRSCSIMWRGEPAGQGIHMEATVGQLQIGLAGARWEDAVLWH